MCWLRLCGARGGGAGVRPRTVLPVCCAPCYCTTILRCTNARRHVLSLIGLNQRNEDSVGPCSAIWTITTRSIDPPARSENSAVHTENVGMLHKSQDFCLYVRCEVLMCSAKRSGVQIFVSSVEPARGVMLQRTTAAGRRGVEVASKQKGIEGGRVRPTSREPDLFEKSVCIGRTGSVRVKNVHSGTS
jgi:hypothetical protein